LIAPVSVPSELDAESKSSDRHILAPRLKAILTLFVWLVTLILSCLSAPSGGVRFEGEFFLFGTIVLSIGALILILRKRSVQAPLIVPLACFGLLMFFPQVISRSDVERSVTLDLYFVVLIIVPAFMDLWSWRVQVAVGISSLFALVLTFTQNGNAIPFSSLLLIATAALLASFTRFVQQREISEEIQRWRDLASRLLEQVSVKQFPEQVWNVMLMESVLLVALIFIDISLGQNELSPSVLTKFYGIAIAVFGSSLAVLVPAKRMPRVVMLTTTLIAFVLSLARIGYPESGAFFALPLICLFLVASFLHWTVELQLQLVWSSFVGDLLIKLASVRKSDVALGILSAIDETLHRFRAEIATLVLGGALSVFLISSLRRYRYSQFSQFVNLYDLNGTGKVSGTSPRIHLLENPCEDRILPERNRTLFFGLFSVGIVSSAISSRLLQSRGDVLGWSIVCTWVGFLLFWAALIYQERKNPKWPRLWTLGATLNALLILWPTVLLVSAGDAGAHWIFWPIVLCVGIGSIPWGFNQLIPLLLIDAGLGIELSYRLELSLEENSILLGAGILSALLSVQNARRLREKYLFVNFHRAIDRAKNEAEVLRVLSDYLLNLFGADAVFLSLNSAHLELLREGQSASLLPGAWPFESIRQEVVRTKSDALGVMVSPVNWLSGRFGFFNDQLGVVSPSAGILVELQGDRETPKPTADSEEVEEPRPPCLFIATSFPIFASVREQELMLTQMLAAVARLKLSSYLRAQAEERLSQAIEAQANQREYELNTLVHDINNTVQDLTLLCELILEDSTADPGTKSEDSLVIERVKRIATIARSVATVVSDAKRRRELERLQDLTPRELVEVTEIVRELVLFSTIRAERKRIQILIGEMPQQKLYALVSFREHLETILRNILNNGILYSRPGSNIGISVHANPRFVFIEVTDNGAGLSAEECEAVFSPGFRGKAASGIQGGLGLGLAESRRVARAAGGDIRASSQGIGRGSTFTVSLPRQDAPTQSSSGQNWALLVDDQSTLTDFYARAARAMHLEPRVASSVDEALEIVHTHGRPRLVMTDIHLGESDGLDLVQRLRELFGPQLPILVISGLNSDDVMRRVREVGATDFVAKPVGRRALFARIQSLVSSEGD